MLPNVPGDSDDFGDAPAPPPRDNVVKSHRVRSDNKATLQRAPKSEKHDITANTETSFTYENSPAARTLDKNFEGNSENAFEVNAFSMVSCKPS